MPSDHLPSQFKYFLMVPTVLSIKFKCYLDIHGPLYLSPCSLLYLCLTFPTHAELKHLGFSESSTQEYLAHETLRTSNFLLSCLTFTHSPRLGSAISVLSDFPAQNVVCAPTASSASLGGFLEMQNLRPHPRSTESEICIEQELQIYVHSEV